jgi:hypothetical protein
VTERPMVMAKVAKKNAAGNGSVFLSQALINQ